MRYLGISSTDIGVRSLLCGAILLAFSASAMAQRHGGGATLGGSSLTRPDGVDEKDSLEDFHRVMEVQATSVQAAQFQALVKNTEAAKAKLQEFRQQDFQQQKKNGKDAAESIRGDSALDQLLESVRNGDKKFVAGFSDAQKSGLKEILRRLDKADQDLEQEQKKLDQSLQVATGNAEVATRGESLEKALTDFANEQLALGREMGIIQASGQDLAFNLPAVKRPAKIANSSVGVTVSGTLSQIAVTGDQRTFKLELVTDLSDLQQNILELLHEQLDRADRCGERVAVRQAMLSPSTPASVLFVRLHFERWVCGHMGSQQISSELGESDGGAELKLTPVLDKSNGLKLTAEFGRIDGNAMMADALRSGDLGDDLRDVVTQSVLSAMQAGTDLKTALPPAVQGSAIVQSAKFQDAGSGNLSVVLEGQVQISNEQANQLAAQLNQTLSAKGASSPQ
jgi:hypothetical protein